MKKLIFVFICVVCFAGTSFANDSPKALQDAFMTALKATENMDGLVEAEYDDLKLGQDVEILSGPMAGKIGKLLRLDPGNRVTVLLQMLGHFLHYQTFSKPRRL